MRDHIEVLNKIKSEYVAECSDCGECGDCDDKRICFDFSAIQALNLAIKALEQERPKGEWINDTRYSGWTCTHCNYHDGNKTDNFCPNCGADMRGCVENE